MRDRLTSPVRTATYRCGQHLTATQINCPQGHVATYILMVLKQGYPLHSPEGCRQGYHPLGVWLVEQRMHYPPNFLWSNYGQVPFSRVTSVMTGIWTHTLLLATPELGFGELDPSARTCHKLFETLRQHRFVSEHNKAFYIWLYPQV